MRWLLFTTLAMQITGAIAAIRSRHRLESLAWFTVAFLPSLQPVFTQDLRWQHFAMALGLAALAAVTLHWKIAPAAGLAAFVAVPVLGGVVNYPRMHTPELARLVDWARTSTPQDAVFVFPEAGHSTAPGIFRAEARRALYVDWKSGGQMVYLPDFGFRWWFRWQQVQGASLAKLDALGVRYAVVQRAGDYVVYDTHTGIPARQSK